MNQRLDSALSSIHTLAVTSTVGVGALIVAIIIGFFQVKIFLTKIKKPLALGG